MVRPHHDVEYAAANDCTGRGFLLRDALKSLRARRARGMANTAMAALLVGLVFGAGARPALAQQSVVIGGRGLPAVEVNLEVLKDLGAPLQRRRLRMPGQRGQDPNLIRLKPPPGTEAKEVTIRTPRIRPERPAFARTGPESPGRDPSVRLRQPGEERSRVPARSTRREVPAVPVRPAERQVLAPPPVATTVRDKKEAAPPIRSAERSPREPTSPERRERVTPPPPPPRRAVERVITQQARGSAGPELPALEKTAERVEPPPLPPRVISREATEPRQEQRQARVAPEPAARPRPLQRPTAPSPARPAAQEKPPLADPAAPPLGRPAAQDEAQAPARSTARTQPAPPAVRPAAPQERQTAALPRARAPADEDEALRVVFSGSSSRLTEEGESGLRDLVQSVAETESRIQLKAFAAGSANRPSTARRLSLSRALAVRSFLIEQGMRSTRIDVRALGVPADDGPADRVDVILLTQ